MPAGLAERIVAYHEDGAAWLDELPRLVSRCAERWELSVLDAYEPGGDASWVAPARRRTGELAVLQITVPSAAMSDQVVALRAWGGRGAVELFEYDETVRASLLECCVPGDHASELATAEADEVAAAVLPQLWAASPPDAMPLLGEMCRFRSRVMAGRAESSPENAVAYLEASRLYGSLPASAPRTVLLHGDFHRRNVLRSSRGWLAVDPGPWLGDPSFDVACFLQHDMDDPATIARADRLSERLDLDPVRTRQWLFAVAVQAASWFLTVGDEAQHRAIMTVASRLEDE
ncbi:aminoglycoside phosphotransferase family protein [Tenggerimyces flavus]|uniref:Aminoglycoside phosphotransferase family protein n=1 Tax=Tenggerimyces flavus TaxID=1708749 RepID=A0ABV7YG91_9ACTN|nr:aminoglycoside phosphotransferase family protein [Tenggerimyces flavus]MBM7784147.1 streptomycin 6-kinase [Tenggerimyces flavus]